ncbi:MAG TPA: hypothetical protein VG166_13520 [Caulobacteraceae bacterium]|jgi:hypothetical protein|nr:hypothetical protein [Caulobacteraceae bacterium]
MIALRTDRLGAMTVLAALGLISCGKQDWRTQTIANAETQMRSEVGDPAAQFSRVQVTGDDKTGQTCGYILVSPRSGASGQTDRFIVYIDQSAGPFVEGDRGQHPMAQQAFDQAWQGDCVSEGYAS